MPTPSTPRKQCPTCSTPAPLDAATCPNCGHVYRTKFTPGQEPPAPQSAITPEEWERYVNQWANTNWLIVTGFFLLVFVVGAFMVAKAVSQQRALKQAVAEAGGSPEQMMRDGAAKFEKVWRWLLPLLIAVSTLVSIVRIMNALR